MPEALAVRHVRKRSGHGILLASPIPAAEDDDDE